MNLYLDIETLPTNEAEILSAMESTITAPGQYKKPESIAEWLAENKAAALKELVAKTSFNGLHGRIACISWAFGDGVIAATDMDDTEEMAIRSLYASISPDNNLTFVGHNVAGFDLPFLKHRSIILGIKPPPCVIRAMIAKPWADCIADTMLMWSDNREKHVSMDKLCRALGIAGKGDFDGSMVANEWENGSKEKVISYCKMDVERTRQIYKRLTWTS